MTLFFRALADVDMALATPDPAPLDEAFYDAARREAAMPVLREWLVRLAARVREDERDPVARKAAMDAVNPKYVLRNYLAQQAIDQAGQGELSAVHALQEVLREPYREQPGREAFARKRPDWARDRPGSSMLSCSS